MKLENPSLMWKNLFREYGKNTEILKPIYNPEAHLIRSKMRGAAERNEYPKTGCTHPFSALEQYIDTDPAVDRSDKPCNLYECGICHTNFWLVDPYGDPKGDG